MSKFGESNKRILSLKVSNNYFSQGHGHKFGQICNSWGQFGQNRSFLVNIVKIGQFLHILGAKMMSYVKILGKWSNNFFSKSF